MSFRVYSLLTLSMQVQPSMWFMSLCITRGEQQEVPCARAEDSDVSPPPPALARVLSFTSGNAGLPELRMLTRAERSRVALWQGHIRLIDDLGDAFEVSPTAASAIATPAPGVRGNVKLLVKHIEESLKAGSALRSWRPASRVLEVKAPGGQCFMTAEQLLLSLDAFESGWAAREGKAELLDAMLHTKGASPDATPGERKPSFTPVWKEVERATWGLLEISGD